MKLSEEITMKLVLSVLVTLGVVSMSFCLCDMYCVDTKVPSNKHTKGYTLLFGQEIHGHHGVLCEALRGSSG